MLRFPPPLGDDISPHQKYRPVLDITDRSDAEAYLSLCVEHSVRKGFPRPEAERLERDSLGYYAARQDPATRIRVEQLFGCAHPFYGPVQVSTHPVPGEEGPTAVTPPPYNGNRSS